MSVIDAHQAVHKAIGEMQISQSTYTLSKKYLEKNLRSVLSQLNSKLQTTQTELDKYSQRLKNIRIAFAGPKGSFSDFQPFSLQG